MVLCSTSVEVAAMGSGLLMGRSGSTGERGVMDASTVTGAALILFLIRRVRADAADRALCEASGAGTGRTTAVFNVG